jgi:hypothetical protein
MFILTLAWILAWSKGSSQPKRLLTDFAKISNPTFKISRLLLDLEVPETVLEQVWKTSVKLVFLDMYGS